MATGDVNEGDLARNGVTPKQCLLSAKWAGAYIPYVDGEVSLQQAHRT